MTQETLGFFDSSEDATKTAIRLSGRNIKEVACMLWPDKSPAAAQTGLLNALNDNRVERLTADQHIAIANFTGRYDWLHFACGQCSHATPQQVTPAAKAAQQQERFVSLAKDMKALLAQMGQL